MERSETLTPETGQASAQAEPKDKKQEHLELGVADVLKTTSCYDPAFRIEVLEAALNQAAKVTQAPEAEPEEQQIGPGATIENKVEQWLKNQSYKTKLAIAIYWEYLTGDHGTGDLIHRVTKDCTAEILRMVKNPDNSLSKEDTIITGIACELFVWSKNL